MARGERNQIRADVAELIADALGISAVFGYTPDDIMVVWDVLPAAIVDWDPGRSERWEYPDQGAVWYGYLLIEVYVPISEDDHGEGASGTICTKLEALDAALRGDLRLNNSVDSSTIIESKVEGIAAEVEGTGIKARFAWLVLEVKVVKK